MPIRPRWVMPSTRRWASPSTTFSTRMRASAHGAGHLPVIGGGELLDVPFKEQVREGRHQCRPGISAAGEVRPEASGCCPLRAEAASSGRVTFAMTFSTSSGSTPGRS